MQTIDLEKIVWSENCVDPGCRVFFVGNRVFRAYEESRKQETMDFLNSDCYAELLNRQMIVKTWIAEDVQIEGYSLILEHEYLCCMPEKWPCFEMLKDILAFHFEINTLCNRYGYGIRDIGFGNVTLKKGRLCFSDFGSFRRIDNIETSLYTQYCLPLAYLPLAIYSKNDGNDFIADSLIDDYDRWITARKYPYYDTLFSSQLWSYLHPIVSFYELHFSRSTFRWKVRSWHGIKLVKMINSCVCGLFPRITKGRDIIKNQPYYSDAKAKDSMTKIKFPYDGESYYPIESQRVLQLIPDIISRQVKHSIKRIILWGNFEYDELSFVRNAVDCELIVMSSDRVYANGLYKRIRSNEDNMTVICCNAMRGKDFNVFRSLKADLLVLQDLVYEQTYNGSHFDWAERASYFAEILLTTPLNIADKKRTKLDNFWECLIDDNQYQLYKNKLMN